MTVVFIPICSLMLMLQLSRLVCISRMYSGRDSKTLFPSALYVYSKIRLHQSCNKNASKLHHISANLHFFLLLYEIAVSVKVSVCIQFNNYLPHALIELVITHLIFP